MNNSDDFFLKQMKGVSPIKKNDRIKKEDLTSEFYLPAAIDAGIKSGKSRVRVFPASCAWMGVTYKEDKLSVVKKVNQMVAEGRYPSPLFEA